MTQEQTKWLIKNEFEFDGDNQSCKKDVGYISIYVKLIDKKIDSWKFSTIFVLNEEIIKCDLKNYVNSCKKDINKINKLIKEWYALKRS